MMLCPAHIRLGYSGPRRSPGRCSRREPANRTEGIPGLEIVAALCRAWGNAPYPMGKTVWAVIGPENRLP